MSAIWLGLRAEARRRWRTWLGLALLVGLFGGVVTAAAAGARRTDDAYVRLVQANHGASYLVEDFVPNSDGRHDQGQRPDRSGSCFTLPHVRIGGRRPEPRGRRGPAGGAMRTRPAATLRAE